MTKIVEKPVAATAKVAVVQPAGRPPALGMHTNADDKSKPAVKAAASPASERVFETTALTPLTIFLFGKGGGGKSYLCCNMAAVARSKKAPVTLFDADPANLTLSDFFPDIPTTHQLVENEPEEVAAFLEEQVFRKGRETTALVDVGANVEGAIMSWFLERGAEHLARSAFIVVVNCPEAVSPASRIFENLEGASMLLVANQHGGRNTRAAFQDHRIAEMTAAGTPVATLPAFGRSAEEMSLSRTPPDITASQSENGFARQGALIMMRRVAEMFGPHEKFRPW